MTRVYLLQKTKDREGEKWRRESNNYWHNVLFQVAKQDLILIKQSPEHIIIGIVTRQ
jgi:hypothetical protein